MNKRWPTWISALLRPLAGHGRVRALAVGFVGTGLVIAALIGVSLHSMSEIRHSLDRLTTLLQSKSEAVATMRENLYLRLVSSRDMMVMKDPFEIDAEAQRFHVYAERIGSAYLRYRELASDAEETALAEEFMREARQGMPLLSTAVNELLAGKRADDIAPLLARAFETQKLALDVARRMQERLHRESLQLTRDAVSRYERTRVLVLAFTALALVLVLSIGFVVTRLMLRHTDELEHQHRRYKTLFEANRDAVLIVRAGRIVENNQRALELFGHETRGDLTGLTLDALSPVTDNGNPPDSQQTLRAIFQRGGGVFEWTFRGRDGRPFFGEVSLTPLPDPGDHLLQLVIRDVTSRTLTLQRMSHEATHDPMTGLANRREFEQRAAYAIDAARDQGGHHVLCFMDLDKFKEVNDLAGHAAGDEMLKQVAQLFKARVRAADLVARLGGDEFGLLLENCSPERAATIVHNIMDGMDAYSFEAAGRTFRVGVSVGLVEITAASPRLEQVLRAADRACYDAKRSGSRLKIGRPEDSFPGPGPG